MKILFLNYEYPPLGGGAANATKYLLDQYKKKNNVSVDLVTSSIGQSHVDDLGGDVHIHYIDIGKNNATLTHQSIKDLIWYSIKGYKYAQKLMRAQKYDFIHAFFGVPCGAMALSLSRKFHVPYIVSLRGADVPGFSDRYERIYPFLTPIIKNVWQNAERVVANSATLRELAQQTAPQQKIDIIYNGVDTSVFTPTENLTPFAQNNQEGGRPFTILVSARLMRRKGIRYAIEAFAKFKDRQLHIPMKMIIAGGDGDAVHQLHQQVANLNLSQDILFAGHLAQKELIMAYQNADVFVLPSLNEGMSNNMLEALACGLPVIVTHVAGAEIVKDNEHGFLVERANTDEIVDALEKILLHPEVAQKMHVASRALAESLSWQSVADQYEKLYYDTYASAH